MENVARGFEVVGVAIIVIGGVSALVKAFRDMLETPDEQVSTGRLNRFFQLVRRDFGRALILGLEVLVAADIIQTITVELSLTSVATLGILVAVRIALSFSLDIEVDGMLPWRVKETEARLKAIADEAG